MIFVDAGAWAAITLPGDDNHRRATRWLSQNRRQLLTTEYIVDETLTLLKARGEYHRALRLGERLFAGEAATIHYLTSDDILQAWQVFRRYSDKEWSFTDCTSKVVMEKLGITTAFAFDQHFSQFGSIQVVPEF